MRALLLALTMLAACKSTEPQPNSPQNGGMPPAPIGDSAPTGDASADVIAAEASGTSGSYQFSVTLRSPDTGCEQYADWWEVVRPDGALVYRRILAHSHVNEQPFTRSGGPVEIAAEDEVIVRAHMAPGSYGGQALRGSPATGFDVTDLADTFAAGLADAQPQPDGCAF